MAEVKDKLVTVESIGALHDYNMQRVIDVAHGGTGATNAKEARANLGLSDANEIIREVDGQQAFVEANVSKAIVDLVPQVSIIAKDTSGDSTGASIIVSDYTNEDMGSSGLIQMKATDIEIEAESISINEHNHKVCNTDINGNMNLNVVTDGTTNQNVVGGGNLKVGGNIVVDGTAEFNDILHIDHAIYVCGAHTGNSHAFGLVEEPLSDGSISKRLEIGKDGKANQSFSTYLRGNEVGICSNNNIYIDGNLCITSSAAGLNARAYGVNEVIWKPKDGVDGRWMGLNSDKTKFEITLTKSVGSQPHGIVLVFCACNPANGELLSDERNFHSFFIPKHLIVNSSGWGHGFTICENGKFYKKYLHIGQNTIIGHEINTDTAYKWFGLDTHAVNNKEIMLYRVYGV